MSHLEDDLLQRYSDGDLDGAEANDLAAKIEKSAVEKRRVKSLAQLGDFVRLRADDVSDDLDSDDLFASIEAALEETKAEKKTEKAEKKGAAPEPEVSRGGLRVIEGGAEPTSERPARPESWKILLPAAALLAAAAVLIAVLNAGPDATEEVAVTTHVEEGTVTVVEAPHGSEVVEVDFGENTGTVFEVEGSTGEPIAVVWISDEVIEPEEAIQ
jgi:hypothetical protein